MSGLQADFPSVPRPSPALRYPLRREIGVDCKFGGLSTLIPLFLYLVYVLVYRHIVKIIAPVNFAYFKFKLIKH